MFLKCTSWIISHGVIKYCFCSAWFRLKLITKIFRHCIVTGTPQYSFGTTTANSLVFPSLSKPRTYWKNDFLSISLLYIVALHLQLRWNWFAFFNIGLDSSLFVWYLQLRWNRFFACFNIGLVPGIFQFPDLKDALSYSNVVEGNLEEWQRLFW